MTLTKYITLRDKTSPSITVNLYLLKRDQIRPVKAINNTEYILYNGSRAIDYGVDKKVWSFSIDIEAGKVTDFTSANLTSLENLYALRTTQTIQLVENWKETATVYAVHFEQFQKISNVAGTDMYQIVIKEV